MRRFYMVVAVPRMLYVADVFLIHSSRQSKGTKGYIRKLGQVQRQATLQIMGAMHTAPTDSIDAHTDLLPFPLLIEKLVHRAAVRLATLPERHPLAKHVVSAGRRYIKRHWAPLHEVLHAFGMQASKYKEITPVRMGPKWTPGFQVCIPARKECAVEEAVVAHEEVKVFSDGSCIEGKVGAAAVLFCDSQEKRVARKYSGPDCEHTVFEAEVVGLTLAAKLICTEQNIESVMLGAYSQAAIRAQEGLWGHWVGTW